MVQDNIIHDEVGEFSRCVEKRHYSLKKRDNL